MKYKIEQKLNSLSIDWDESYYVRNFEDIEKDVKSLIDSDDIYSPIGVMNAYRVLFKILESVKNWTENWENEERHTMFLFESSEREIFGCNHKLAMSLYNNAIKLYERFADLLRKRKIDKPLNDDDGNYTFFDFKEWYLTTNLSNLMPLSSTVYREPDYIEEYYTIHDGIFSSLKNMPLCVLFNDILSALFYYASFYVSIEYDIQRVKKYCYSKATEKPFDGEVEEWMIDVIEEYLDNEESCFIEADEFYKLKLVEFASLQRKTLNNLSQKELLSFWEQQETEALLELKKYPELFDTRTYCENMMQNKKKYLFISFAFHCPGLNDFFSWHIRELYLIDKLSESRKQCELNEEIIANRKNVIPSYHEHFPPCLEEIKGKELYAFLVKNNFISAATNENVFLYLLGCHYECPAEIKLIQWRMNKQLLRELLELIFAPLIRTGSLKKVEIERLCPLCFEKEGKALCLAKPKKMESTDSDLLKSFFRP